MYHNWNVKYFRDSKLKVATRTYHITQRISIINTILNHCTNYMINAYVKYNHTGSGSGCSSRLVKGTSAAVTTKFASSCNIKFISSS
jgi:hypothetical protein